MPTDTTSCSSLDVARRFPGAPPSAPAIYRRPFNLSAFDVNAGEFVSIVGPSGCGKSTLLNFVAGLDGRTKVPSLCTAPVAGPNSSVGFMLQKDLLLPWRTVLHNVEFGLEARKMAAPNGASARINELKRCRITDFADRYPYQISGGQRQRAALARTLAIDPAVVLLDEPFSALDAQTKLVLQRSFAETIATAGLTTLLITHDLSEAVAMSDRILVMSDRPRPHRRGNPRRPARPRQSDGARRDGARRRDRQTPVPRPAHR